MSTTCESTGHHLRAILASFFRCLLVSTSETARSLLTLSFVHLVGYPKIIRHKTSLSGVIISLCLSMISVGLESSSSSFVKHARETLGNKSPQGSALWVNGNLKTTTRPATSAVRTRSSEDPG